MKKLYLLRGVHCAGKSTLVERLKLTRYTISLSTIRDLYSTPAFGMTANQKITTYRRNITLQPSIDLIKQILTVRMQDNQTTIIDAPNLTNTDIKPFIELAKQYQYQVFIVNVGLKLSLNELLKRNAKRENIDQVSEAQLRQDLHVLQTEYLPVAYQQLTEKQFIQELAIKPINANKYHDILVIGDVQSCGSALKKALGQYRPDRLYILLGDYFDRGCEPVSVMKTLQHWCQYPNVILISGNHEIHLEHFANNEPLTGKSFQKETLPALTKAGFTREDVRNLLSYMHPVVEISFHQQRMFFTHAGLANTQFALYKQFSLQDDTFFTKGIGGYNYDLDVEFNKHHPTNLIQFHGHRNSFNYPVIMNSKQASFNLEQKAEHGNKLGAVLITNVNNHLQFADVSVKNDYWNHEYVPFDQNSDQRLDLHVLLKSHKLQSKTIAEGLKLITIKPMYRNMTQWTSQMTQANNIVVDTGNHLVARSYPHPVKLMYHNQQSTEILHKLAHADLTVLSGIKSPIVIVSFITRLNKLLIFSPDVNNEQQKHILELMNQQLDISKLTTLLKSLPYSLVFQLENDKAILITAVANTYQGTLAPEIATRLSLELNLPLVSMKKLSFTQAKNSKKLLAREIGKLQLQHTDSLISVNNQQVQLTTIEI